MFCKTLHSSIYSSHSTKEFLMLCVIRDKAVLLMQLALKSVRSIIRHLDLSRPQSSSYSTRRKGRKARGGGAGDNCDALRHNRGTQRICSSHYLFPRGILLAGKNTGVSISWLGNFVIDRGFAWELLTFSSISTQAGCRNSED